MLEEKDLDVLKSMMETVVRKSEENILKKVDDRLVKSEENILKKVDDRLVKSEENILKKVDDRLVKSEENILKKVDDSLTKSENLILDEVERTRNILEDRIDKIQRNLDELSQYYRITKLENDNTSLLLKMIDELTKRVEELEKRSA